MDGLEKELFIHLDENQAIIFRKFKKNIQRENLRAQFYFVPQTPPENVDVMVSEKLKERIAVRAKDARNGVIEDIGGYYNFSFNRYIYAEINGGGPVYVFNNNNGDILLRKAK